MAKSFMEAVMNPVRLRVMQFLASHGEGTAGQLRQALGDVPAASLYRHLKVLLESGCIQVARETPVRGAVERVYALKKQPEAMAQEPQAVIEEGLFSLMGAFRQYFEGKSCDPVRDMLLFSTATLMLSDEEYQAFLQELGKLIAGAIDKPAREGRRVRRLTLISSPSEEGPEQS